MDSFRTLVDETVLLSTSYSLADGDFLTPTALTGFLATGDSLLLAGTADSGDGAGALDWAIGISVPAPPVGVLVLLGLNALSRHCLSPYRKGPLALRRFIRLSVPGRQLVDSSSRNRFARILTKSLDAWVQNRQKFVLAVR
jgi:hypothetical protein